jgi:hypothetical protein
MPNQQLEAISKELHPQAKELAREYVNDFATALLLQAKVLAYQRRADVVLSSHVEEAQDVIGRKKKETWSKELVIVVGGALLGAFIQGFITELSTGRTVLIVVYTVLGFIGMLLVFWGLRR